MNNKLSINKLILFFALFSVCLNIFLLAYIIFDKSAIKPAALGSQNQILGKWEKVIFPEDQPYDELIPQNPGIITVIGGQPTATPKPPILITVVPKTCRTNYPNEIEFFNDGTYTASRISPFQDLRGGDYQITEDGRLKTESQNSLVTYELFFQNNQMTLTLANCQIQYQKTK